MLIVLPIELACTYQIRFRVYVSKIRVFVSFSELSIVLTCKSTQIFSRAENICLLLEVRNVLKRWRPAPFLGKFPFFSISRQARLGMSISVEDILRWKKLRKKMVANVFYARARDSCQTNVMCQLRMFCLCETRLL